MARLHGLDPPEREHVGEVDQPELVLVDLQPRMRMLAAHVVHRLGEVLDHARELALAAGNETPRPAQPVPAVGEPALSCAPAPRTDHVLGLGPVNRLERLVEPAQRLDGRRQLVVMRRVLLDVLDQARRVRDLRPPVAGHVPSNMAEAADAAAATPGGDVLRCGRRAIMASSSFTDCGRWAGSFASTFWSSWSSSSGRLALIFTTEGIGVLTVA